MMTCCSRSFLRVKAAGGWAKIEIGGRPGLMCFEVHSQDGLGRRCSDGGGGGLSVTHARTRRAGVSGMSWGLW